MVRARVLTYSNPVSSGSSHFLQHRISEGYTPGLQNPFSNSGDIKKAKKAVEPTFSDFNHYKYSIWGNTSNNGRGKELANSVINII